jgi:hypothetical protein
MKIISKTFLFLVILSGLFGCTEKIPLESKKFGLIKTGSYEFPFSLNAPDGSEVVLIADTISKKLTGFIYRWNKEEATFFIG